ncbi:hypothetical protein PSQ19_16065 [Devosia algicola]|uniref:Uncharacterized protein n=1 Tax=Devosia algicola TaxID=3026418 RepID=A0ABY7YM82_9HYPH|nr:hypothetical protein [Devosia algicola]WDR02154.1 hypothetical protein PSQ19_16065 [Devosia algicola]
MSQQTELIRAILQDQCRSHDAALTVLQAALLLEVDPLDYCAMTLGVGQAKTLERSARWAGLAHFNVVPRQMQGNHQPARLEALADVRAFKVKLLDRDVLFCAPQFFEPYPVAARGVEPTSTGATAVSCAGQCPAPLSGPGLGRAFAGPRPSGVGAKLAIGQRPS